MKVLISSSYKFLNKWDLLKEDLERTGFICTTPKDIDIELFNKYENLSEEEIEIAHKKFYEYLDNTDILYLLNYNGYVGKSMMAEMGYAKGIGKKIYMLEENDEPAVKLFIDEIAKPGELMGMMK